MTEPAPTFKPTHWRIDVPFFGENRIRAVVAVTDEQFYMAQFATLGELDKADRELAEGGDPALVLGKKKLSRQFSTADIVAVEEMDFNQSVFVLHRKANGSIKKETIPTYTEPTYAQIFDALHEQLASDRSVEQVQASAGQVIVKPVVFLTLAILARAFCAFVAIPGAREPHPNPVGRHAGAKMVLEWVVLRLGFSGVMLIGAVVILLLVGWLLWRLLRRPVRDKFEVGSVDPV